jgi:hypothetical protein
VDLLVEDVTIKSRFKQDELGFELQLNQTVYARFDGDFIHLFDGVSQQRIV